MKNRSRPLNRGWSPSHVERKRNQAGKSSQILKTIRISVNKIREMRKWSIVLSSMSLSV